MDFHGIEHSCCLNSQTDIYIHIWKLLKFENWIFRYSAELANCRSSWEFFFYLFSFTEYHFMRIMSVWLISSTHLYSHQSQKTTNLTLKALSKLFTTPLISMCVLCMVSCVTNVCPFTFSESTSKFNVYWFFTSFCSVQLRLLLITLESAQVRCIFMGFRIHIWFCESIRHINGLPVVLSTTSFSLRQLSCASIDQNVQCWFFFSIVKIYFRLWLHSGYNDSLFMEQYFPLLCDFYWLSIYTFFFFRYWVCCTSQFMAYRIDVLIIFFPSVCLYVGSGEWKRNRKTCYILYFARDFFPSAFHFSPLKKNNMFTSNEAGNRLPFQNKCK